VRIDGSARSASGRTLGEPYAFSFVTPTVRLLSAEWYRQDGRSDSPAVIALRFNQPVRRARRARSRRGGFDHVEKHDDRMVAYATRLSAGRHEISYLVRATTAGTFTAQGAWGEAMYAPEITGRSAAVVLDVSR
jgi:hypothetical protein